MKIIHNKILGGWYIVRGPHQAPIGGRFDSKAEAQASLSMKAEKREIDRKVASGKATRKQVLRGLDIIRKSRATGGQ